MPGQGNIFDAELGPSQPLVQDPQGFCGAAVAKPLSALTRQSN